MSILSYYHIYIRRELSSLYLFCTRVHVVFSRVFVVVGLRVLFWVLVCFCGVVCGFGWILFFCGSWCDLFNIWVVNTI